MSGKDITKIFDNTNIRTIWDDEKEKYYFSVVDVISALTNSNTPRKYWNDLKRKLISEGSELSGNIGQLKMKSSDNKKYFTDVIDTEQLLRLIQSVPSKKAEPFKMWLATVGNERIDETFDPEMAIRRALKTYELKGFSRDWINNRLKTIDARKQLTDVWRDSGINNGKEYAILTDEIYRTWSGFNNKEYKAYKGLKKESLRDNMTNVELVLNMLAEVSTKELVKEKNPFGLNQNIPIAKQGGNIAKNARVDLEAQLGKSVISTKSNKNLNIEIQKTENE